MLVIFLTFNAVYWLFFLIRFTIHFPFPEGDQSYLCYQLDVSPRSKTAQYSQSSTFQVLCIFPTLRPVSGAREREREREMEGVQGALEIAQAGLLMLRLVCL